MNKESRWQTYCEWVAMVGFMFVIPVGYIDGLSMVLGGVLVVAAAIGRFFVPAEVVDGWIESVRRSRKY